MKISQEINKLMIVAHPDDETIFGGMHLLSGGWLVICTTYNKDDERGEEFFSVMRMTGNEGVMLGYPDMTNGHRDNWSKCKKTISRDIKSIILSGGWNRIVTHNPDGEYIHNHHIMISEIVRKIVKSQNLEDRLFYFGTFVEKDKIDTVPFLSMEECVFNRKLKLIDIYQSQPVSMTALCHIFPYEYFIPSFLWHVSLNDSFAKLKQKFSYKKIRRSVSSIIKYFIRKFIK